MCRLSKPYGLLNKCFRFFPLKKNCTSYPFWILIKFDGNTISGWKKKYAIFSVVSIESCEAIYSKSSIGGGMLCTEGNIHTSNICANIRNHMWLIYFRYISISSSKGMAHLLYNIKRQKCCNSSQSKQVEQDHSGKFLSIPSTASWSTSWLVRHVQILQLLCQMTNYAHCIISNSKQWAWAVWRCIQRHAAIFGHDMRILETEDLTWVECF